MITAAAIIHQGKLFIGDVGKRHHDVIHAIAETMPIKRIIGEQGFVDEHGNFYSRGEAAKHALQCGQVKTGVANIRHEFNGHTLYSEDIW